MAPEASPNGDVTGPRAAQGRVDSHCATELIRDGGGHGLADSDLVPGKYEGESCTTQYDMLHAYKPTLSRLVSSPDRVRGAVVPGGFKLWEGGLDLARFLCVRWALRGEALLGAAAAASSPALPCLCAAAAAAGRPARLLELGCGQALPGLLALLAGAEVHFQVRGPGQGPCGDA